MALRIHHEALLSKNYFFLFICKSEAARMLMSLTFQNYQLFAKCSHSVSHHSEGEGMEAEYGISCGI